MKDHNLIIIASQPRSGSTILQALLSNNDMVGTLSEPWLLLPFLGFTQSNLNKSKYNSKLAKEGVNDFKKKIGSNEFDKDLATFLLKQYTKVLKGNESMVLDKTPRYYEILDEILDFFPNCKIIILKRHPLSVLNSIIKTWNTSTLNKLLEYKRDLLNAPFILNEFVKKHQKNPQVFELKYEDLVTQPEKEVKSLYQFLSIPFDKGVLNYSNNIKYRGLMGDPSGVKSNQTPHTKSLNDWQNLLKDTYWKDFVKGYLNYLSNDFLHCYGGYQLNDDNLIKPKKMFSIYLEISSRSFKEHDINNLKLLKYTIIRRLGLLKY